MPALGVELRSLPVFPPPGMVTASTSTPQRLAYTLADAARVAAGYGLMVRWPDAIDTEWVRPHACAYLAAESGRETDLIAAAFAARFERGLDLVAAPVLAAVAREAGIDPDACVAAADDPARQGQVAADPFAVPCVVPSIAHP